MPQRPHRRRLSRLRSNLTGNSSNNFDQPSATPPRWRSRWWSMPARKAKRAIG
jgi:hypothetical protein